MANGIELATAYVTLTASTRGMVKDINAAFAEADKSSAKAGKKIGDNLSSGLGGTKNSAARAGTQAAAEYERALKSSMRGERIGEMIGRPIGKGIGLGMKAGIAGAAAAATGAVALLSHTLTKGFQRLQTIDQATFKLQALGHSTEEVAEIMASATDAVRGTAFSMADAVNAAASATAAGVKPGKDLTRYLVSVADSAAVAGTSFDEMATIYNKVTASQTAYTDDLQMLQERSLPIFQWLQDQYGVNAQEMRKMVEDGKVSSADFQAAIDANIGGAAQKMGQSFSGAVDNMHTAVARLGANFLAGAFGGDGVSALAGPTEAVNKITEKFNELDAWVQAHEGDIQNFFHEMSEGAEWVVEKVADISGFLAEHPDLVKNVVVAFAAWKTIQGVTSLITSLQAVSTLLSVTIPASAATGAAASTASLAPLIGALKMLPIGFVGLGGVKDATELGLPEVQTQPDGSLSLGPMAPGSLGGGPFASRERRGVAPPDPTGGLLMPGGGGGPGGPVGNMPSGLISSSSGQGGLTTSTVDGIASQFGLTKSSGLRSGDSGYHGSGQAGDYAGPPAAMQRFAAYMQQSYGSGLLELIYDAPGWGGNVKNGQVTGPFGNVYTMDQAGDHTDHVHVAVKTYDQGGVWPTDTLGINTTGKDEYVLTPEEIEELKRQGVDPATMQHGMGQGALPGPTPEKLDELTRLPGQGAELMGGSRTEGYIPAGAGSTAVAGESFMSSIYGMGAEVINGVIDQAASMASSAAGMAATAFAPGSGGAASGLTSAAIGMGTQAIKRGVDYGAQMLGIVTDSFIEQATPFGAPRILSTDPTAFMPQQALMDAATTSLEKAFQPQQPEGPQAPEPVTAGASAHVSELEPGTETGPQFVTTVNATVKDVNELNRTLNDQQRLNIMQYSGRP